jgi:hypothetical protein
LSIFPILTAFRASHLTILILMAARPDLFRGSLILRRAPEKINA